MPAWVAWMVQTPGPTRLTVAPVTVQTDAVSDAKLTGRPDDAAALTTNGLAPNSRFASGPKVMVWLACVT